MNSIKATARQAGILYLLLGILAPVNFMYIPRRFIVPGDAAATASNITAAELTYRLGIFSGFVADVLFIFLVLTLYQLFKDVDRKHAMLMVTLVVVAVTIALINLLNQMAPLILLSGADFLSVFTQPQLEALSLGFLRLRSSGSNLAAAFWGLWLFPFGLLVIKSGFFPRVLGVLLFVAGVGYLTFSFTTLVFPGYRQVVSQVTMPLYFGELPIIIWLLVKGAKVPQLEPQPAGEQPEARPSHLS